MRKGWIVFLAAVCVAGLAMPAAAEIQFFGTARIIPTYYSNFDFDDDLSDFNTLNEAGFTSGEHVRAELRLGWQASGDKWKIKMIAETDLIYEKDTVDRSFYTSPAKNGLPNAGGEFGIERADFVYTFTPALEFHTGWDISALDIGTGGLLYGDDHPVIGLRGRLTDNLKYQLLYIIINNMPLGIGGADPFASTMAGDWRAYTVKIDATLGSGDTRFTLSPLAAFSDFRVTSPREANVYYFGLEGVGQIGIIKPSFEAIFATGEFNDGVDIDAFAAFAAVEVPLSKAFNPYVAVRFTSGDGNAADDKAKGFVGITDIGRFTPVLGMDGNILGEHLLAPPGAVSYQATLYSYSPERAVGGNAYGGIGAGGSGNNPGQLLIGFGTKGDLSDHVAGLSYKAQAMLIWYDKTDNLTVGAGKPAAKVDDYAGTTIDLQLRYALSKNFSISPIVSAFIPGDGIKDQLPATADDTFAWLATANLTWVY
jgi:hypothetical protein